MKSTERRMEMEQRKIVQYKLLLEIEKLLHSCNNSVRQLDCKPTFGIDCDVEKCFLIHHLSHEAIKTLTRLRLNDDIDINNTINPQFYHRFLNNTTGSHQVFCYLFQTSLG
eukprot:22256_1